MKIKVYGESDDLMEVRIDERGRLFEEESCNSSADGTHMYARIGTEDAGLVVRCQYAFGCCWTVGVQLWDESCPIPDWRLTMDQAHEYSVALTVECPDGTPVEIGVYEEKRKQKFTPDGTYQGGRWIPAEKYD